MPELPINLSGTPTYKRAAGASPDNLSVANREYNPLNDTSLNYATPKKSGYDASSITMAEAAADRTGRYKTVMYGYDNEEAAAQRQSLLDKGANGILKGIVLLQAANISYRSPIARTKSYFSFVQIFTNFLIVLPIEFEIESGLSANGFVLKA